MFQPLGVRTWNASVFSRTPDARTNVEEALKHLHVNLRRLHVLENKLMYHVVNEGHINDNSHCFVVGSTAILTLGMRVFASTARCCQLFMSLLPALGHSSSIIQNLKRPLNNCFICTTCIVMYMQQVQIFKHTPYDIKFTIFLFRLSRGNMLLC